MPPDKPSPPQNLQVTEQFKDFITIAWDIPESDGGSPITGYIVEKCDVKRKSWVNAGRVDAKTLTLKVTKLVEGNEYMFRVYAENDIGKSDPGEIEQPVMAKLPFDKPGPPVDLEVADVTKTTAQLSWQPPESDGGSPVTGYYIEKSSGKRWVKVNKKAVKDLTLSLEDLIEKETYEVRVAAENQAGVGMPCQPVSFVAKDPYDVPGKPGQPEVDIKAESASLTWQAPDSDGGSPIINYIVEMRGDGETKWKMVNKEAVTQCQHTVEGLKEETEYEFRITAENKAGKGPASAPTKAKYGQYKVSYKVLALFNITEFQKEFPDSPPLL